MPPAKPGECDRALDFIVVNPRSGHALESCSDKGALIASALAEKSKLEDHEKIVTKYGISSNVVDFQKFGIAFDSSLLVPLVDKLCLCGVNLSTPLLRLALTIILCLGSLILGVLLRLSKCCLKKYLG